ncbi:MAG TPA: hypothetical protein EYP01_05595, partial [Candidatus Poseidoniales archaeon]|nr:hypothetical protein [Candidatus Poseidoniales archaeon]
MLMRHRPSRECVTEVEPPRLSVLRLGHRRERDKRITSHLGLTARAFGPSIETVRPNRWALSQSTISSVRSVA